MAGSIDLVTVEGIIEGWCWNESRPNDRVTVIIAVDGKEAARTVAADFREDLKPAGIGDGCHAFRQVLPFGLLEGSRSHRVTIVDAATGIQVGEAYEYKAPLAVPFDDRLSALEARAALLEGRVKELPGTQISEVAAAELFAVVGAFFERLSRDIANGKPVKTERLLGDSIQALIRSHPQIIFPPSQYPTISIVVEATQPFGQLYACLEAVKRATRRVNARITVLDTGAFDDVALLPSVARGIRYVRTNNDLVSEWIEAERDENSPFLMFLNSQGVLDDNFIDSLMEWFDSHPRTGAIGGCDTNFDGTLVHGGLCLFDDSLEDCAKSGHSDNRVDMTTFHPVHALSYQAAVVRRTAFQAAGGLDPIFGDDLGSAVIDLCFRLREAHWTVGIEPRARVGLPARSSQTWVPGALSTKSPAGDLLHQRWLKPSTTQNLPLFAGLAAIIAQPGEFRDEIDAVRYLREADFLVAYISGQASVNARDVKILRDAGATIRSKMDESGATAPTLVFTAMKNEGAALRSEKTKKAKFVEGLADLKRLLRSNFTLSTAN